MLTSLHQYSLKTLSVCVLTLFAGLALEGCGNNNASAQQAKQPTEVGVVTLKTRPLTLSTELPGRTTAHMIAEIRPQISGIVKKRVFTEGSFVKTGQLLYQIDPATYQAAYDSAKAALAKAEATLYAAQLTAKRDQGLLAIKAISAQTNETAQAAMKEDEAAVSAAKADLETARINLQYTRISSPISGRIETSTVTQGALVTADQTTALTTVQQLDPIYVDIPQSSVEVLKLRQAIANGRLQADKNEAVAIKLDLEDGSTYKYAGKLQFTGTTVDTTTGSITLRALFPNPDHLLMPGMYVRAKLNKGTDPNALLAPQRGISRDSTGKATAMVVNKNGVVEIRNVTVTDAINHDWLVSSGLVSGDRLIVEGSSKVHAGESVAAIETYTKTYPSKDAASTPVAARSTASTTVAKQ